MAPPDWTKFAPRSSVPVWETMVPALVKTVLMVLVPTALLLVRVAAAPRTIAPLLPILADVKAHAPLQVNVEPGEIFKLPPDCTCNEPLQVTLALMVMVFPPLTFNEPAALIVAGTATVAALALVSAPVSVSGPAPLIEPAWTHVIEPLTVIGMLKVNEPLPEPKFAI